MTLDIRQVALVWLVALLLGAGHLGAEEEGEEKAPPLGDAEARALLEEAAAMPRVVLDEIVRMGAMAHPEDLAVLGSFPLTQLIIVLPFDAWRAKTGESADIRMHPALTPQDIRDALRSGPATTAAGYSLLRADAITKLTLEVTGLAARGTVAFRHGESIEGSLEWTAVVEEGRWRVLSLWGPQGQRGVVWRRGQWNYAVRHPARRKDEGPAILTAGHLAIPSADLPRLALVGDLLGENSSAPPDVLHVAVTPLGRILLPSGMVSLGELRSLLTESTRGLVIDVHGSRRNVVLRAGRETPWHVVGWTIGTLEPQEGEPPLHLYVAAAPEDLPWEVRSKLGELGAEGVMALHGSKPADPAGPAPLEIVVEADPGEVPAPTLHRVLREQLAATPGRARGVRISVGSEGRVLSGHVLRVAELALRAGARDVLFAAAPIPPVPEGEEGELAALFTVDHVGKNPVSAPGFSVRVGSAALRGDPPLPPLSRALWQPAGADLTGR